MNTSNVSIIPASLKHADHQKAVWALIDDYRVDPLGGPLPPMSDDHARRMIEQLDNHPTCLILLAKTEGQFVGLIIAFVNISSFQAMPFLNVHDLIVNKDFRKQGIGKRLLLKAGEYARSLGCCRLTLEVRTDNTGAQKLYQSIGFAPCKAPMEFWHWTLDKKQKELL